MGTRTSFAVVVSMLSLSLLPGCATTWALLKLAGTEPIEGEIAQVTPLDRIEHRVVVEPVYETVPQPQEAPLAEPMPPPEPPVVEQQVVVEVPAPLPPRPTPSEVIVVEPLPPPPPPEPLEPEPLPPLGRIRLDCAVQQRPAREHVVSHSFSYGIGWKLVAGFMAVSEGTMGGLLAHASIGHDGGTDSTTAITAGFLLLDALASAALIFLPTSENVSKLDRPGTWDSAPGCPDGLSVGIGGSLYRASKGGELEAGGGERALEQLVTPGAAFELRLGERAASVMPSPAERCQWALSRNLPDSAALCVGNRWKLAAPVRSILELAPTPLEPAPAGPRAK